MTKTSLPGCMQSALVSCPYEVWGPSRALPAPPGLPFSGREGWEEGLEEGDSCPHPVLPGVDGNFTHIHTHRDRK